MNTSITKKLLTAGLCLLAASHVQAAPEADLKVSFFGYYQSSVTSSKKFLRGNVKKTRVSTKQLLKLISQTSGRNIPGGSKLMVNDNGTTQVVDRQGNTILDSSEYVQVRFYEDSEIIDGVRNLDNGKEKSRAYYKIAMAMNLQGLSGTLNGMAIEKINISAPNRDGVQKFRTITDSKVNGRGQINGGSGFYEGSIKLNSRGATIQ
jgi:hypothetical protein